MEQLNTIHQMTMFNIPLREGLFGQKWLKHSMGDLSFSQIGTSTTYRCSITAHCCTNYNPPSCREPSNSKESFASLGERTHCWPWPMMMRNTNSGVFAIAVFTLPIKSIFTTYIVLKCKCLRFSVNHICICLLDLDCSWEEVQAA